MVLPAEFWIFLGGGVGSLGRFWASRWLNKSVDRTTWFFQLPLGSLFVNVFGSFLLGFMIILYRQHISSTNYAETWLRVYIPLFFIGFCGGFTTFSSYIMDVYLRFLAGDLLLACLLLALHVVFGLVAAGLGIGLAWCVGSLLVS